MADHQRMCQTRVLEGDEPDVWRVETNDPAFTCVGAYPVEWATVLIISGGEGDSPDQVCARAVAWAKEHSDEVLLPPVRFTFPD